jgi:hypothetical protein
MRLQSNELEFAPSSQPSGTHNHTDWSFLSPAVGGMTGVIIGLAIATILGWY